MAVEIRGTTICMPCGETDPVRFEITEGEITEEDRGVFTIAEKSGKPLLRKIIAPNEERTGFDMMFTFDDTAEMRAGGYEWSFRVVKDAQIGDNGKIERLKTQQTPIARGELRLMGPAGGAK